MNRRDLFKKTGALSVATFLPLGTMELQTYMPEAVSVTGIRVSCVKGDAGELLYAKLCGDGKPVKVFLDGVEQKECVTADETQGFIVRHIITEKGNAAFNPATGEVLQETIKGAVRIEIGA